MVLYRFLSAFLLVIISIFSNLANKLAPVLPYPLLEIERQICEYFAYFQLLSSFFDAL
jgi:hypothetical protein